MATNTTISNAGAIAMLNALVDLLDAGSGAATVKIYTGTQPANPDVAVVAQTLLATLTCSDPAFGNAVDDTPGALATADTITADAAADATGTATWFRAADSDGTAIIDGSVGTSDADMILNTTSVVSGAEVEVTAWTVLMPES